MQKNQHHEIDNPLKIAIYHTGALGDLLVSTAAIFELANLYPKAKFTLIGSELWKDILIPIYWQHISHILEIKNKKFSKIKLLKSNKQNNSWDLEKTNKTFKQILLEHQISIDLRSESVRFSLKSFLYGIPIRIGASKNKYVKRLFTHFILRDKNKEVHERDRYLDILSSINKEYIDKRKEFWKKEGLPPLKWFPSDYQEHVNLLNKKKIILINPTASIREKAWESKKFRELALKLKEMDTEIKIIGSPKETEWLKEVAQDDFSIIQPDNILSLVNIVERSSLLITNTSSMQFIAAGTSTPTLTLMGSASPERWGALGSGSYCLKMNENQEKFKKIFISKKKLDKLKEQIAYNKIPVNLVFEKAQEVLLN
ncbi:glycosyltransferase family 9 protein [Silvanigrella sp.]|uniref:glycosyltransferase family 9 protein n=1 Tax=Silvanigrella sp. TaxID=2024976 RepID=UPI0037C6F3B3